MKSLVAERSEEVNARDVVHERLFIRRLRFIPLMFLALEIASETLLRLVEVRDAFGYFRRIPDGVP